MQYVKNSFNRMVKEYFDLINRNAFISIGTKIKKGIHMTENNNEITEYLARSLRKIADLLTENLDHHIALGVRHGLFGINADEHASIANIFQPLDDLKNEIIALTDTVQELVEELRANKKESVKLAP